MTISFEVAEKSAALLELRRRGICFSELVHKTTSNLRNLLRADDALMRRHPQYFLGNYAAQVKACPFCEGDMWKTGQWTQCRSCGAVADPFVGIATQLRRD